MGRIINWMAKKQGQMLERQISTVVGVAAKTAESLVSAVDESTTTKETQTDD